MTGMQNVLNWMRSLGAGVLGIAGAIAAAPAGMFDPRTTAVATAVAATGAAVAGLSHIGLEAVNPATFPQTALTVAQAVQAVAPGTQAAQVAATAPVALAAIATIQQVHTDAVASAPKV